MITFLEIARAVLIKSVEKRIVAARMMYAFAAMFTLSSFLLQAQEAAFISGKVVDKASGTAIAGCSVYFSNSSKGTSTNSSGQFVLKNLPSGKYQLVISAVGYQTEIIPVASSNYPHDLKIGMRVSSTELSEVTVHPVLKDGWEKWGSTFMENFIGATPDTWQEQGYNIVSYVKRPNVEKQRVKKLIAQQNAAEDSMAYYKRVMKQSDTLTRYVHVTSLDSMLTVGDDESKSLFFDNKLEILYKPSPHSGGEQSEIYLITPEAITIEANGSYSSPKELVTALHWEKYEKLANLLPFDYSP